jgi:hypothetical protein
MPRAPVIGQRTVLRRMLRTTLALTVIAVDVVGPIVIVYHVLAWRT